MKRPLLKNQNQPPLRSQSTLQLLTGAALLLPGLLQTGQALAADDDEVDFGYSHYQEGARERFYFAVPNTITGEPRKYAGQRIAPIEADSLHGSARISLTDRLKFNFNFIEDTWSGATPYGSAPEQSGAYGDKHIVEHQDANGNLIFTGASPLARGGNTLLDRKGNFYYQDSYDPLDPDGTQTYAKDRMAHVMSYASPETRKQGDFKLGYEWDEAAASLGGGISDEADYLSRFVNLGGKIDFNQKRSIVDVALSYTNSDTNATKVTNSFPMPHPRSFDIDAAQRGLRGNRQDWSSHIGLTQVVNQDALLNLGMGYSRNTGLLENPYKITWFGGVDPTEALVDGLRRAHGLGFYERRPEARNQWNWNLGWTQYLQPFDAALHFNYQFSHDDWAINAHTLDVDWVQPLGGGWTLTPRIRYYSQSAASFYQAYFVVKGHADRNDPKAVNGFVYDNLPASFSSDQRLSGYGALSGGLVLAKQFVKGISFETGFEYYSHQGGLKLGGGGEQAFADYDFWVANAALKLNLSAIGQGFDGGMGHNHQAEHGNLPAGLMFAHTLSKAGDMMAGYRYQHSRSAGDWLHGDRNVGQDQAAIHGCPGALRTDVDGYIHFDGLCPMLPNDMTQSMHMLELMYAPSDWLTLMLMPQFMDMDMAMGMPALAMAGMDPAMLKHMGVSNSMNVGGIGDTGVYALFTLFDAPGQHLHASLGGTAPTGDVAQKLSTYRGQDTTFKDYSMQLGSGTWDLKPSLTYTGKAQDWSWGAQMAGTWQAASRNASGYKLGDMFESSVWGGYDFTRWLSSTLRLAYSWQGSIKGRFPRSTRFDSEYPDCIQAGYHQLYDADGNPVFDADGNPVMDPVFDQAASDACLAGNEEGKRQHDAQDHMSSQDYPKNYGGHYLDLGLGISANVGDHRLAFEWQQPLYTNVNGYQLDRDHFLTFTWSVGF